MKKHAPSEPPSGFWKIVETAAGRVRSVASMAVGAALVMAVVLLVVVIVRELAGDPVIIEPLLVPESANKVGWTGEALARQMRDRLQAINEKASKLRGRDDVVFDRERVDVALPGGLISIRTIVTIIRGVFNLPERRVTAEVIENPDRQRLAACHSTPNASPKYILVGRLTKSANSWTVCGDALEQMAKLAAERLMAVANPYALASYYADSDPKEAKRIICDNIMHSKADKNEHAWGLFLLGHLHLTKNDYYGAIKKYERATLLNPEFALAYNRWGTALSNLNKTEDAADKYNKAISIRTQMNQLDTDYAFAWWSWGNSLTELEPSKKLESSDIFVYERAISLVYERAIRLDPNFAWAYNNWGEALRKQGKPEKAVVKLEKATLIDPRYAHAYKNWGDAYYDMGKFDLAAEKYRQTTLIDPKYPDADLYHGWGNALYDRVEALEKYKRATEINADNPKYSATYCKAISALKLPPKPADPVCSQPTAQRRSNDHIEQTEQTEQFECTGQQEKERIMRY